MLYIPPRFCKLLLLPLCFCTPIHSWTYHLDITVSSIRSLHQSTPSFTHTHTHCVLLCVLYHPACRAKAVWLPFCAVLGECSLTVQYSEPLNAAQGNTVWLLWCRTGQQKSFGHLLSKYVWTKCTFRWREKHLYRIDGIITENQNTKYGAHICWTCWVKEEFWKWDWLLWNSCRLCWFPEQTRRLTLNVTVLTPDRVNYSKWDKYSVTFSWIYKDCINISY